MPGTESGPEGPKPEEARNDIQAEPRSPRPENLAAGPQDADPGIHHSLGEGQGTTNELERAGQESLGDDVSGTPVPDEHVSLTADEVESEIKRLRQTRARIELRAKKEITRIDAELALLDEVFAGVVRLDFIRTQSGQTISESPVVGADEKSRRRKKSGKLLIFTKEHPDSQPQTGHSPDNDPNLDS